MKTYETDILIVGAGPVGLMCAYLSKLCGLKVMVLDKSAGPLQVGRADALNARTLQLLELGGLFQDLYPLGKPCNTSSVWADGKFVSRQSAWWEELEGCFHKHFLMLGQSYVEKLLDEKLVEMDSDVFRSCEVTEILASENRCVVKTASGDQFTSKYLIGCDGSRSLVRETFEVPFEIVRPQIVWAVIDGIIESDFPKVPEIIVFQSETSDVAWIPREGEIDRFYVRMDTKEFELEEAISKINRAMNPHTLRFREVVWYSQFSVKESVAEKFRLNDRVFLAGDACHIHSVNGGQGLNTGLADAFNLIWKLNMVLNHGEKSHFLDSYETERKPVAKSVIDTSGELVRSTKFSETGNHAEDYVKIVRKRSGNVTGMGIRYGASGLKGERLFDFEVMEGEKKSRIYSHLDYSKFTLLVFGNGSVDLQDVPEYVSIKRILSTKLNDQLWTQTSCYSEMAILVRPDSYIADYSEIDQIDSLF